MPLYTHAQKKIIEILIFVKFVMYILQNYIVIFDKCGKSRHRSTL